MMFKIAMPVPLLLSLSWLLIVQVMIMVIAEKNPAAAGYRAIYLIVILEL